MEKKQNKQRVLKVKLIDQLYNMGLVTTKTHAADIINVVSDYIKVIVANNREFRYAGLGTFTTTTHPPRKAKDPRSGEIISIGQRRYIKFKPSAEFKKMVREKTLNVN